MFTSTHVSRVLLAFDLPPSCQPAGYPFERKKPHVETLRAIGGGQP